MRMTSASISGPAGSVDLPAEVVHASSTVSPAHTGREGPSYAGGTGRASRIAQDWRPWAGADDGILSADPDTSTTNAQGGAPGDLRGKRVVICEDEAVTQMQLRRALTRAGLSVVGVATNGREAVETTLSERPDIVLMDIRMPLMDGIAASRKILETYPVCVVMLTAFSNDGYQDDARDLGVSGYIVKPITSDVLIPLLQQALDAFEGKSA